METEGKKCACKGANLDRFIQPMILLILTDGPDTGYAILKKAGGFSMFREEKPDATGVYRYLRLMEKRGLLEQYECREAENKYKMKIGSQKTGSSALGTGKRHFQDTQSQFWNWLHIWRKTVCK
ncbi:MAG: hypothetical protein SOY73_05030 [Blautia sp.]|nr:PadR family transcriptional regulator [Blautia sp.]MDY3998454.1 hypothetical protein [Blautia sp.]